MTASEFADRFGGTWSHGTMRNAHLIAAFTRPAQELIAALGRDRDSAENPADVATQYRLGCALSDCQRDPDGFDTFDQLWNVLDGIGAAFGYYFGSHPGDGSDFGYWPLEDAE